MKHGSPLPLSGLCCLLWGEPSEFAAELLRHQAFSETQCRYLNVMDNKHLGLFTASLWGRKVWAALSIGSA